MTAAAWHPDPTGRHELRYWDGNQWTEHVSDAGVVSSSPLQPPAEPGQQEQAAHEEQAGQSDAAAAQIASDRPTAEQERPSADQWISAPADEPAPMDESATDRTVAAHDPLTDPMPVDEATPAPSNTEESMGEEPVESSEPPLAETMMVPMDSGASGTAFPVSADAAPSEPVAAPPAYQPEPTAYQPEPVAQPDYNQPQPDYGQPSYGQPDYNQPQGDYGQAQADYGQAPPAYAAQPPMGQGGGDAFQGITGDLVDGRFGEVADTPGPSLQNSKLLKVRVVEPFMARNGAMVAYQGNINFNFQGGGAAKFLKKALTGEGLKLMRVEGQGDVFLADSAYNVHILHINNSGLSINGSNVLAFSASLDWNIERVKGGSIAAGGLFNTTLRGTGWVAITTDGDPVVLNAAEAPTFADTNAIVAWSVNLQTSIKSSFTAGALIGRGSGEAFQVAFQGPGFVIVQPSEGVPVPTQTS